MTQQLSSLQTTQYYRYFRRQFILLTVVGLTGCTNIIHNQNMASTIKPFKSFQDYWSRVSFWDGTIPTSTRTSYPVPVLRKGQVQIAYMVCPFRFGPKGSWIWPPNKVAWEDPVSGKLIVESSVSPADFGQTDSAYKFINRKTSSLPNITMEEFDALEKRLYILYDILFEVWAINPSELNRDKLRDPAREFLKIFYQVSQEPLKPYYEALGRDWFGWLRALAQ